ncbi:MAG: glycosyltransferase [Acidobacteria bacterium]|nr:glycosyltransferase [Acidobacteriota bacterium]MBI3655022.1 glycosyltransferase [Acidobacteriota bacterium]
MDVEKATMEDQVLDNGRLADSPRLCSIIIVNYNGSRFLFDCFSSLLAMKYPADLLDIIMVDNGSTDDSIALVQNNFPTVRIFKDSENSFCKAVNLGILEARGDYIGLLNNDTIVDENWLMELANVLNRHERAGAVGGKILFKNGIINSVGIDENNGYFRDRGFGESDIGQYDKIDEVQYVCGAGVLYRRQAIEEVGPMDNDFVIYVEDVDYGQRLRKQGWKILFTPWAKLYHEFQGSSKSNRVAYYFCTRNRLLFMAKHRPYQLPGAIKTTAAFRDHEYDVVFDFLPAVLKKLFESQDLQVINQTLSALVSELVDVFGNQKVENLLARMEVALGYRKLRIGIYDHALHFMGGGQKYVCTLASVLQDKYDITYICNKPVTVKSLNDWYDLDLSRCRIKVIPLPFFEERHCQEINAAMVTADMENPFQAIAMESANYDFFINANMLSKCLPLSNRSILVCHFPDTDPGPHFAAHKYTHVITNGEYTTYWLRRRWGMVKDLILHPPVNMYATNTNSADPFVLKENLILSVARFEQTGSKKQKEMVKAFNFLCKQYPSLMKSWRLCLAGGSLEGTTYADEVKQLAKSNPHIDVKINLPATDLRRVFAAGRIFWHLCGLDVDENESPQLIEHFGMTTVEAMQNYCVPIVNNGGGQKEIVAHGESGFLIGSLAELCEQTRQLISEPDRLRQTMLKAYERGHQFNIEKFTLEALAFFKRLEDEYVSIPNPIIAQVAHTY